jgi:glycosyltransferase involved in cell wall biosynthesis
MHNKLKVLLIIEQCNPEWASVPLEGYNYYQEISRLVDVTLVTHERNRSALEKIAKQQKIIYISESNFTKQYYNFIEQITSQGRINWPLKHALTYPIYAEFDRKVYQQFKRLVRNQYYDIVHVLTPMMPRYPAKIIKVCQNTPFLLGPVNGGVPFPDGFQEVAKQESAGFNFLRAIGRNLIPGYVATYQKADRILAGSTYTLKMLQDLFQIPDTRISLFYENGILKEFLTKQREFNDDRDKINLLFVGRLVPYKGADMLVESIAKLDENIKKQIYLNIVGDGSEKANLEARIKKLNLDSVVRLIGWVKQQETLAYYQQSDLFCFPSIREFGGAVVLEAMACGLPCLVVNNGGIGEYVTEQTGFKIEPISREYVIQELTNKIQHLVENRTFLQKMSVQAIERAKEFEWSYKAEQIVEIYQKLITYKI